MLAIIDTLTLPGFADRPNEDRFGCTPDSAFVIDGATGLGPKLFAGPGQSDAAWIAELARLGFDTLLRDGETVANAVRAINSAMQALMRLHRPDTPAWAVPIAAFQAITWRNGRLDAFGLGDCSLFLIDATGTVRRATGLPGSGGREAEEAAAARAAGGALAGRQLYERDDVMERLRADRARFNRKDGPVWTIGAEPEAANHIHHVALAIEPPVTGLLASDGFAALVDSYRHFDAAGLLAAARQDGLTVLGSLLRQLERVADPECAIWPRYKVSDDATAVLFTIGA